MRLPARGQQPGFALRLSRLSFLQRSLFAFFIGFELLQDFGAQGRGDALHQSHGVGDDHVVVVCFPPESVENRRSV